MTDDKWEDFLNVKIREEEIIEMKKHEQTGRPLGSASFVEGLENALGRFLKPKKGGGNQKIQTNRYGVPRFSYNLKYSL